MGWLDRCGRFPGPRGDDRDSRRGQHRIGAIRRKVGIEGLAGSGRDAGKRERAEEFLRAGFWNFNV